MRQMTKCRTLHQYIFIFPLYSLLLELSSSLFSHFTFASPSGTQSPPHTSSAPFSQRTMVVDNNAISHHLYTSFLVPIFLSHFIVSSMDPLAPLCRVVVVVDAHSHRCFAHSSLCQRFPLSLIGCEIYSIMMVFSNLCSNWFLCLGLWISLLPRNLNDQNRRQVSLIFHLLIHFWVIDHYIFN